MPAIVPDMRRAAPIRQDSGRPHVLEHIENERNKPMMTQGLAGITFSEADKAEVARLVDGLYADAVIYLRQAERLREAAGLTHMPASGAELYAYLVPRQAVQR